MFDQLLINAIIAGSIYTLIALGFSLICSTTKFFHFAHREFMSSWGGESMSLDTDALEKR